MKVREIATMVFLFFNAVVGAGSLLIGERMYDALPSVGVSRGVADAWLLCASFALVFSVLLMFWSLLVKEKPVLPPVPLPPVEPKVSPAAAMEDLSRKKEDFEWRVSETQRHVPPPPQVVRKPLPPVEPPRVDEHGIVSVPIVEEPLQLSLEELSAMSLLEEEPVKVVPQQSTNYDSDEDNPYRV